MQLEPLVGAVGFEVDVASLKEGEAASLAFAGAMDALAQSLDGLSGGASGADAAMRGVAEGAETAAFGLSESASSGERASAAYSQIGGGAGQAASGLREAGAAGDSASAGIGSVAEASVRAGAGLQDVEEEARGAAAGLEGVGEKAAGAGQSVSRFGDLSQKAKVGIVALGVGLAGIGQAARGVEAIRAPLEGVARTIGEVTTAAADYDEAVTFISTLSQDAASRQDEFKTKILEVSQALGQDAVAGARAAYDAISSGVEAADAMAFLETSSKAATAGLSSVDTAGKALTVTLNSFNLPASETVKVSDALFQAANVGVTTFDELATSFGGVASIASASKASYQETLAALAQITTKGASTSEAVTQLKSVFSSLAKPDPAIAEALAAQGFASADAAIEAKGLQYVMELVRETSERTGEPLISLLGRTEAVNAVLATTGVNAEGAREKVESLANAAGATDAAFAKLSETPAHQMAIFSSSVEAAKIALGDALLPVMGTVLDAVTPLVQGFASFATNVLQPLGQAFADLPQPITLVITALGGLVGVGAALVTGLAGIAAVAGPIVGVFTGGGVAAGIFSAAMGVLGTAASGAGAAVMGALGPIGLVVGVLGTLYVAVNQASEALDAQFGALDKSTAGFDDYANAVAKAKAEAGLLGQIGLQLKGAQAALSDEFAQANHGYAMAGELLGLLWNKMTGGQEATDQAAAGLEEVASAAQLSANEIVLAGQAWLEQGTNIAPAVLASDQFALAQARINERLREGKIDQAQYQEALLEAANAASIAQGQGAVLTAQQQSVAAAFADSLGSIAAASGTLSEANLNSEGFAAKQAELANAVAGGTISTAEATSQWKAYLAELAAGDPAMQAALSANEALASGFSGLVAGLEAGTIGYQEAAAQLQALGEAAGATQEQMAGMAAALQERAISPDLAQFGVSLDFETLADPEALAKELEDIRSTAHEAITGLFSEQLRAREEFQAQEQAIIAERGPALAQAEADARAAIEEARAAGDTDRVAELEAGLQEELAAIAAGNEQKLQTLRTGYETERQDRLNAIAQAALDQVNAMLSLGQISEQQAQVIFGWLKQAAPDSSLFDAAAAASLEFSAQLGQALAGNVEAAVGLGGALTNIDVALDASSAKAGEYEAASVQAFQNAQAAMGGTVATAGEVALAYDGLAASAAGSSSGAVLAAETELAANQTRVDSGAALVGAATEQAATLQSTHAAVGASSTALADLDTAEQQRRIDALLATGQITEAEYNRMISAMSAAGAASSTATGDMVSDTQRLRGEAAATGGVVDTSVRGIGTAYLAGAAGVREGAQGIVVETGRANTALSGLGTEVPGQLAPAAESVQQLRSGVQELATDVEGAARQRASADEEAARAATGAADDTVRGLGSVAEQGAQTREEIDELKGSMEALPKKIEIPLTTQGIKEAQAALEELAADLKALQTAATIRIYGEYIPKGDPMKPDQSLRLQHDIEDAIAAAEPGITLSGTYDGAGGLAWGDGGLVLADAIAAVYDQTSEPLVLRGVLDVGEDFRRLLFDPDFEAQSLANALAEIARLEAEIEQLGVAMRGIEQTRLAEVFQLITAQLGEFFSAGLNTEGSLASILVLMRQAGQLLGENGQLQRLGGVQVNEGEFLKSLGFDVSTFDELARRIAELSGEPEKQREMWQAVIKGLSEDWKRFYDEQKDKLADQKKSLEAQKNLLGPDADTSDLDRQIDNIEEAMAALDLRNRQITDGIGLQNGELGRMLDAYKRINGEVDELKKAQADAAKELADWVKKQEDAIRSRQRASEDAEKSAHREAMDLLEEELRAREKAHKREMDRLDDLRERTQADIKRRISEEETAHEERLARITAEVDAADAVNDAEEQRIKRARLLLDAMKAGNQISTTDADFLRSLGIDPDQVLRTNTGLNQTKALIDETKARLDLLKGLVSKIGSTEGRVRLSGGVIEREFGRDPLDRKIAELSQAERDALQKGIDDGTLTGRSKRLAEIALAGGVVRADKLRQILEALIRPEEAALSNAQKQVELAGQEVDLAAKLLAQRETALKVAQDDARVQREALADQIAKEKEAFENFKVQQNARLTAIDAERTRVKEAYDDFKEAIAEAKRAEQDRHEARMRQIQAEYALELLRLGNTEAEVQRILNEQAERAARIAAEAAERFRRILAEADAAITPPPPPAPNPFAPPALPPPGIEPPVNPRESLEGVLEQGFQTDATAGAGSGVLASLAGGIDRLIGALGSAEAQWAEWSGAPVVLSQAQTAAVAAAASTTINNRTLQNWGPIINGQGMDQEAWAALMDFLGVGP